MCGTVAHGSQRRPHLGGLCTRLSVKAELHMLSLMRMKPCSYSFVDIGSDRARRDRNLDEFDTRFDFIDDARVRSILVVLGVSWAF